MRHCSAEFAYRYLVGSLLICEKFRWLSEISCKVCVIEIFHRPRSRSRSRSRSKYDVESRKQFYKWNSVSSSRKSRNLCFDVYFLLFFFPTGNKLSNFLGLSCSS